MATASKSETAFTRDVKLLRSRIHNRSTVRDSIYEQAEDYFCNIEINNKKRAQLVALMEQAEEQLAKATKKDRKEVLAKKLKETQDDYKMFCNEVEETRLQRVKTVYAVADALLDMLNGKDTDEYRRNAARFLTTTQLASNVDGKRVAELNEKFKHQYKAAMAAILLNHMTEEELIKHPYIVDRLPDAEDLVIMEEKRRAGEEVYNAFREEVQLPLIVAALLQDAGNFHPDAQKILRGSNGKLSPFRVLEKEERIELLKINYRETLKYISNGIGQYKYIGNSKAERDIFNEVERQKLKFIRTLLKKWVNPQKGIGNLLKIPQIYTSVVLSTKESFDFKQLPKVETLLRSGVERKLHNGDYVESLLTITGKFPMGYGVVYIPKDMDNKDADRFEYAIVNALYPEKYQYPTCRIVTRNLTFGTYAQDCEVSPENNLYYSKAREKLERLSKERFSEIMDWLSSNSDERIEEGVLPSCWYPHDYFSAKQNQNMWNRADRTKV